MKKFTPIEVEDADGLKKLTVSRRHVLGQLYPRCEHITEIPVFMDGDEESTIGRVDEGMGVYADAFVFHLEDQMCKRLAAGQFTYSFDYSEGNGDQMNANLTGRPIKINRIFLVPRKGYQKPIPRSAQPAAKDEVIPDA